MKIFFFNYVPILFLFAYIKWRSSDLADFGGKMDKLAIVLAIIFAVVLIRLGYIVLKLFFTFL